MDFDPLIIAALTSKTKGQKNNVKTPKIPSRPIKIPFPPTEENIPKLEKFLLEEFDDTAFNRAQTPFPVMSGKHPPAHIHVLPDAKPRAHHTPITVPLNLKKAVKARLDDLVARGIIELVPANEPCMWCSVLVVTLKKDGTIRLNS